MCASTDGAPWLPYLTTIGVALASGCYRPEPITARELLESVRAAAADGARGDVAVLDERRPLDPGAAVAYALLHNPELRALRRERQIAEGEVTAATELSALVVRLQVLTDRRSPNGTGFGTQASWEPPQPFVLVARHAGAVANRRAVEQEVAEREWQMAASVRTAHATVISLDEEAATIDAAVTMRRRVVEAVTERVRLGASTRIDLDLARLALVQAEQDRGALVVERAAEAQRLLRLMGAPGDRLPPLVPGPAAPRAPVDEALLALGPLEERAVAARPVVRAASARYAVREQGVRLAQLRRWPWLELSIAPGYRTDYNPAAPTDVRFAIDVTLPLFWQRGGVDIAEAARSRERERERAVIADIVRDIAAARADVIARGRLLEHFRDAALPALDEHHRMFEIAFQAAELDVVRLLQSESVTLRMQRDHVAARLGYAKAWIDLDRAVGEAVSLPR